MRCDDAISTTDGVCELVEQFYGFGFEVSGLAAMAIQQALQPKDTEYEYEYE